MRRGAGGRAGVCLAGGGQLGLGRPQPPHECRPKTMADGMQVQDALVTELDFPVGGWKVGCTSAYAQRYLKIKQPIAGRVFATRLFDCGVTLTSTGYRVRGIEGEFAFVFGRDLPPRSQPYTRADAPAAIAPGPPAIQL